MTKDKYRMSNHVEIAKTIQSQIVTVDNMALFAWGAKKFAALPGTETTLGGLQFVVNGLAFKGIIVISLNGSDLYEIEAKTKSRINRRTMEQTGLKRKFFAKDIYAEDLVNVLDSIIEIGANQHEDFESPNISGVRGGRY